MGAYFFGATKPRSLYRSSTLEDGLAALWCQAPYSWLTTQEEAMVTTTFDTLEFVRTGGAVAISDAEGPHTLVVHRMQFPRSWCVLTHGFLLMLLRNYPDPSPGLGSYGGGRNRAEARHSPERPGMRGV